MEQNKTSLEKLNHCPVCSSSKFKAFISCKDYTVSNEKFHIEECINCGFKFTNPRPGPTEIGKYYESADYISHSNSSKGVINFIYQIARRFTLSGKMKMVKSICPDGKKILDYGCGTGEFLNEMKNIGWNTSGVEPNESARNFATKKYLINVINPADINSLQPSTFNIITLWHVLEHIHSLNETIFDLLNLLEENGKIIIAVPNNKAFDQKIYADKWAAYDLPRHLYHFNLDSIIALCSRHNLKVINYLPMPLDAFYVSMLSEKNKKSSFGFIRGIFVGLITLIKSMSNKENSSSLIFIVEKQGKKTD